MVNKINDRGVTGDVYSKDDSGGGVYPDQEILSKALWSSGEKAEEENEGYTESNGEVQQQKESRKAADAHDPQLW